MSESITDTKQRIETFISESFPNVDIAPGSVLSELLVKLSATLQNPIKNDITELAQTDTVTKALASPTDTYNEIIDGVASNYGVYRNDGKKSVGKLKITLNDSSTIFVDAGFTFFQPVLQLNFVTTADYRITTNPNGDSDELKLTQNSKDSSLYTFVIPVEAADVGEQYQLNDQTSLNVADNFNMTNFVDAKAYGNFTTGLSKESDKELITRFKAGLTHKTLLNKTSIFSRVKEDYPNLREVSVITANDAEMTRPKQNVFGISTLGMADVYMRTSFGLETTLLSKVATKTAAGVWAMDLDYNDVPGFYRIISVLPTGLGLTGSLLIDTEFGYNNTAFSVSNQINDLYEARFSKYQTATVTIQYIETDYDVDEAQIGDNALFDVLFSYQPDIGNIQDLLLSADERILCADYLIKAALPCFVTVNLKLVRNNQFVDFPVDLLKQDIYKYINNIPFGDDLQASAIIDLCHNYDIKRVQLPIKLSGEIYSNHSTLVHLSSVDALVIPDKFSLGISKKTTLFVSNYFNTGIDPDANITDAIGIVVI